MHGVVGGIVPIRADNCGHIATSLTRADAKPADQHRQHSSAWHLQLEHGPCDLESPSRCKSLFARERHAFAGMQSQKLANLVPHFIV